MRGTLNWPYLPYGYLQKFGTARMRSLKDGSSGTVQVRYYKFGIYKGVSLWLLRK